MSDNRKMKSACDELSRIEVGKIGRQLSDNRYSGFKPPCSKHHALPYALCSMPYAHEPHRESSIENPVPNTQYPIPITQYPIPITQYPLPNIQYPIPSNER